MELKDIFEKLSSANSPVSGTFHHDGRTKVIFIGFRKDMVLKKHVSKVSAKLLVLEGEVVYIQDGIKTTLKKYEQKEIVAEIFHEVYANQDSLCLLVQG